MEPSNSDDTADSRNTPPSESTREPAGETRSHVPADPQATGSYENEAFSVDAGSLRDSGKRGARKQPRIAGYEILSVLGRGGMGVVYKARQIGLNRLVALKMILAGDHASDSDVNRFRIEAEAVARLQHPHIVQIHEIGEADGVPFFSLEFVEGGSLASHLRRSPQPPLDAARMIQTLAETMQYAHEHGIIHRDLKPANILLSETAGTSGDSTVTKPSNRSNPPHPLGRPKIADFGLAKQLDDPSGQTQSGAVLGTRLL